MANYNDKQYRDDRKMRETERRNQRRVKEQMRRAWMLAAELDIEQVTR